MIANNIKFVRLNLNDLKELKEISKRTYYDSFAWGNTPENMQNYLETSFSRKKLTEELSEPDSEFYFSKNGNITVGYIKINFRQAQTDLREANGMEVERIYILKEFQGKKIGQLLISKAIEIAKQNEMDYIWLGVWEKNVKAIEFYKKQGFITIGKHDFIMGDDEQTDLVMKLIVRPITLE